MKVDAFDYELPEQLIAQTPLIERTASRVLTLHRHTGVIKHHTFQNIIQYLRPGDLLVMNNSKVLPARLFGVKQHTGAKVEVLLLKQEQPNCWEAIVKPGKKVTTGTVICFGERLQAKVMEQRAQGARLLRFTYTGHFYEHLAQLGHMPLPPYIKTQLKDNERYQTVYAKHVGSAAAPTAGLHFTQPLLEGIKQYGIRLAYITLHVGLGTFRPLSVTTIEEHVMHAEYYEINANTAQLLNETRQQGGRIIAVGTTSARTLETIAGRFPTVPIAPSSGWTDIFIYPGYSFKLVQAMITNFHLPKSTLIMLVSALAGRDHIMAAYQVAMEHQYRFFSFGDAMFIYE